LRCAPQSGAAFSGGTQTTATPLPVRISGDTLNGNFEEAMEFAITAETDLAIDWKQADDSW
jgi:hypothetical protein